MVIKNLAASIWQHQVPWCPRLLSIPRSLGTLHRPLSQNVYTHLQKDCLSCCFESATGNAKNCSILTFRNLLVQLSRKLHPPPLSMIFIVVTYCFLEMLRYWPAGMVPLTSPFCWRQRFWAQWWIHHSNECSLCISCDLSSQYVYLFKPGHPDLYKLYRFSARNS